MSVTAEPLSDLRADVAISRAAAAARRGELDVAAELLADLTTPAALDLLARVHAQRERWEDADRCWARLQEDSPANLGAAEGRKAIAAIVAGNRRSRPLLGPGRVAVLTGVFVAALVAAGTVWWWPDRDVRPAVAAPTTQPTSTGQSTRLEEETRRADELERRLAKLEADRKAAAARLNARLDEIARTVMMPGVTVHRQNASVRVLFTRGLFIRDDDLTTSGSALLTELGPRLTGTKVTVVGHSVAQPGSPTHGGTRTALTRARVASQHLAAAGNLPLTTFTLTPADQSRGPFPDAPRNRTVTLLLTPASR
jgi:type VI secretion system protein ImpK